MPTCPSHSRSSVDNNPSEWDLTLALSVPDPDPDLVSSSAQLDRNSPNVHVLSSKLAKCKEDVEAWDDDLDFVSFEPIFEQLQFQQSGRLPRSPMSDASSSSATDYFQVQTATATVAATATSTTATTSLSRSTSPIFTSIPIPIPTTPIPTPTPTSTKIPSSSIPSLMTTPPTTPQTSPTAVHRKSIGGTESHPHPAQKRVEALGTTIHVSSTSSLSSTPFLFPAAATTTTASSSTTSTSPTTSSPTSPLSLLSSSTSTSPASLTATVTTAVTTLPSLRFHRQNTLTTSSSSGSLFATNFPFTDALPPAPISISMKGKQSHPPKSVPTLATTPTPTPTLPTSSSWLSIAPTSLETSSPSSTPHSRHDDDNTVSTTAMTTITQEMMSSMATYSGVITRINPIRRVAAWVDDLDDLEVPEQDLDFNQVRTTLAKSSLPETLEATEGWDTESEGSVANEDHFTADLRLPYAPLTPTPKAHYGTSLPSSLPGTPLKGYVPPNVAHDAMETLEDAFDPNKFGSFKSTFDKRQNQVTSPLLKARPQINSLSRQINVDLGRDVHFQNEPEDFWEGIEIEDDQAFHHKGRNKNLVLRPNLQGRARSGSRVQREVVPLKDFVALPSRIPRLCRAPGDTSRAITPAPALSRTHSTHFDLPLRNLKSKSSLPRLKKQPSVIKREGKSTLSISSSDGALASETIGNPPSPFVSRATTPIPIQLNTGHRSSWHLGKDDLYRLKSSSLALRSVSFVEGSEAQSSSAQSSLSKASGTSFKAPVPEDSTTTSPPPPILPAKSFATFRTMVKKWDWGRQKSVSRGHIPSFLSTSTTLPDDTSSIADEVPNPTEMVKTATSEAKPERPPVSRSSSSYSDLNHAGVGSDSRPPSRSATATLEVQLSGLDVLDGVSSTGSIAEKFPKRFFLKQSLKHNSFGDGFELDQFDNLPTYQAREEAYQVQIQEMEQGRRQSMDRVTAWLRKPQSNANLKEMTKIDEMPTESEVPETPKPRKPKSIRRSLFDIFGPNTSESAKSKKKRKKVLAGPTLTPIHSQASVHKFSDSLSPQRVPWGNEDANDDEYGEERTEYSEGSAATDQPPKFDFPAPPQPPLYYPTSPLNSAIVNRPALITNLGQFSKQRTQVSGKMMFDPVRMCWIFNPEYLARRRRRGQRNNTEEDDIWGDEPDVFAGLSDDDSDKSDENYNDEEEWDHPPSRNSSVRRGGSPWIARRRLLHRPSFPRYPSQEFLKEDEDAQALESTKVPPTTPASVDGNDSRQGSMGVHSVVSKSSRRSLNVHGHGFCSNGVGSCGEFEVGVEFDITEDFLEQCIAAEAQHRKDAGKFFALPCSPPDEKVPVANVTMAKILTLGKKSGKTSVAPPKIAKEEAPEGDNIKSPPLLSWTGTLKSRSMSKAKSISKATSALTKEVVEGDSITLQPPPQELSSRRSSATLGLDSGVDFAMKKDKEGKKKTKNASIKDTFVLSAKSSKSSLKKSKKDAAPPPPLASFSSWQSSTTAAGPASRVATMAVRGRSGSRQKVNTLKFDEQNYGSSSLSAREPLSFSATLAVARKGKYNSFGKRRIDAHTFDPPVVTSLAVIDAGDVAGPIRGGIFRLRRIGSRRKVAVPPPDDSNESEEDLDEEEFDEDEYMDRGYRSMSNSRGRPPLRPRADLLFEFEKFATTRFHR